MVTVEHGIRKVEFYRSASGRELHLWGIIPKTDAGYVQELAISDPALYAATVLRDALLRRGVSIQGEAVPRHRFPDESTSVPPKLEFVFAEHHSPPLLELLQVVDKVSQNLHAEMFLREAAVASGRAGSREAGLAVMDRIPRRHRHLPRPNTSSPTAPDFRAIRWSRPRPSSSF